MIWAQQYYRSQFWVREELAILGGRSKWVGHSYVLLKAARLAGVKNLPEIVCYEKQNAIGGYVELQLAYWFKIGTVTRALAVCTAIYGQMAPKNA